MSMGRLTTAAARQGGGGEAVYAATGTGLRADNVLSSTGAAQWAATVKTGHYAPYAFDRIKIAIPLWFYTGVIETLIPEAYDFQCALEFPFVQSLTGLGARKPFLFSGVETYSHNGLEPPLAYAVSDELLVGQTVAANTKFGLHTTHECVAGRSGGVTNKLIISGLGNSSFINRFEGQTTATSSLIASNYANTGASYSAFTAAQSGVSFPLTPCMILIPHPQDAERWVILDNSIGAGVGEGSGGSGTFGDVRGDQFGNAGYASRWLYGKGKSYVNLSKGSDGDKFRSLSGAMKYRLQGIALANPTHIMTGNPHNDISGGVSGVTGWAANTVYAKYAVKLAGGSRYYMARTGGTSGSTAPVGTGKGIVDGTVVWDYIGTRVNGGQSDLAASVVGLAMATVDQIRAVVPTAKILPATCTPDAASTISVTNLTSSGTTCTGNVPDTSVLTEGQNIAISGASPAAYNGTFAVHIVDATTISYTAGSAPGSSPATGTILADTKYTSLSAQTPTTNFGVPNAVRTWINAFNRAPPNAGFYDLPALDLCLAAESGYTGSSASETGKWNVLSNAGVPVANGPTNDKTHPTSWMHQLIANALG
jgi:hypothetical protein